MSDALNRSGGDWELPDRSSIWRAESGVIFAYWRDLSQFLMLIDRLMGAVRAHQIAGLTIDVERDEHNHLWVRLDGIESPGDLVFS